MPSALAIPMPGLKTSRIMARKKFSKLLRLMKYAREANLKVVYVCPACKAPVQLKRGAGDVELVGALGGINEKTDAFSLSCACTRWTVR